MHTDEFFMKKAIQLAQNATGRTSPNPLVGAIIVKNNEIIAEGWHKKAGTPHAEVNALNKAGDNAFGATMYVTLEPCSHHGRTPPCTNAIIASGIKKVVVAVLDPNPLVSGKGIAKLKKAGIEVVVNILKDQARQLNEVFFKWITTKMPFVVAKYAMTLDGKIATKTGHSQWISCEQSRTLVHKMRDVYDGIMVGIGTVIADNPSLTCRMTDGQNPSRIIVDSMCRIPKTANVLTDNLAPTYIAVTNLAAKEDIEYIEQNTNAKVIVTKHINNKVNLKALLSKFAENKITSILLEGGAILHGAMLQEGLVDKYKVFIAPKIIGGACAKSPIAGNDIDTMFQATNLHNVQYENIGNDILITAYTKGEKSCLLD